MYHDPKKGQKPRIADFMYQDYQSAREETERATLNFFRSMKAAGNG